jgi:leucyl/phenylalanyl-tRNA--protein transferase
VIPWLDNRDPFPPVARALRSPNGLLAAGGDLSVARLLAAYRRGIFPWFNPGEPVLWWSPDPRMVLFPSEFRISRSLKKRLARADYEVRVDTAFTRVMRECAAPRDGVGGTWISPRMIAAYGELHEAGHAHSFETWIDAGHDPENGRKDGAQLAGGLYGVAVGRAFFGESMFTRQTDASKIALAHLVRFLALHGFGVIDCQMNTPHLASLGAREIPRADFSDLLSRLTAEPRLPGKWSMDIR